jgi:hypothetical protein
MKNINPLNTLLSFRNMHWFLPMLLVVFYVPQSIVGVLYFDHFNGNTGWVFIEMLLLSLSVYVATVLLLRRMEFRAQLDKRSVVVNSQLLIWVIVVPYLLMYLYVVVTAKSVPLWEALQGACSSDLALYREELFRTRIGLESLLNYANSIFTVLLMPYAMLVLYLSKHKYRHWVLVVFVFSLLISLEKSLILRAALPILILVVNGQSNKLGFSIGKILISIAAVILIVASITKGVASNTGCAPEVGVVLEATDDGVKAEAKVDAKVESNPYLRKYFPLGYNNPLAFLANRIVWIPYITAIDTLNYSRDRLNGELLLGRSSAVISYLTGQERYYLEREVFRYEWSQNSTGTGSANAVFISDAFVNFGWLGIVLGSMLLALITQMFIATNNIAAKSIYYTYALLLSTGSIFGVLFSGGLLLALFIAMFIKLEQGSEEFK